jgi:hypothetical protein
MQAIAMNIELLEGAPRPPEHALVVYAGTVTCANVEAMGSGFNLFKQYFDQDLHSNPTRSKGWIADLNQKLTGYRYGRKLSLYCQIARQGTYIGGIATVACLKNGHPITPTQQKMSQGDLEEQYKTAVRLAIQDAIQLQRPLYIQPLGIGVYGWEPSLAATLFGEVLAEFQNTAGQVLIPLYDQHEHSPDRKFATQLLADMEKGLQPKVRNGNKFTGPAAFEEISLSRARVLMRRIFIWKSLALLSGTLSAALIFAAGLAMLSFIAATPLTTVMLGVTGLGLGLASCLLFRRAKKESDIVSEHPSLVYRG